MPKPDDAICGICGKSMRKDNLKRHQEEKHEKKLPACACGKRMCASSLARHKRNNCPLRNTKPSNSPETSNNSAQSSEISGELIGFQAIEGSNSEGKEEHGLLLDEEEFEINTKVRFVTYQDGTVKFFCDPIKIGDYSFVLNQTSVVDGKSQKFYDTCVNIDIMC